MRLRVNVFISALALFAIIWGVHFAAAQEQRRTPEFLQQKYQKLNRTFFENSLPTARLEWADLTDADAVGQTFLENDDSFVIQVDRRSDFWDDDDLQDTVKHETCHIATWGKELEAHGPRWQACMARILRVE